MKKILMLTTLIGVLALTGCASTKVENNVPPSNMAGYENIYITEVKVESTERNAAGNEALKVKLSDWQQYSTNQLEEYIQSSQFEAINSIDGKTEKTLSIDLYVNVQYGNRALRWAAGIFGAGKGGVSSTLTAKDAVTDKVLYRATALTEMKGGGAGGDINNILVDNVRKLIETFRAHNAASN